MKQTNEEAAICPTTNKPCEKHRLQCNTTCFLIHESTAAIELWKTAKYRLTTLLPNEIHYGHIIYEAEKVNAISNAMELYALEFTATKEARILELEKEVEKHKRIYGEIYDITDKQNFEV